MENKIDFTIPEAVLTESTKKLNQVVALLKPYLIALTPEERMSMPKMSDKTQPFVEKTIAYCAMSPQFIPLYLNVEELNSNMKVYKQLMGLFRIVRGLNDGLDDTTMQAGGQSYSLALSYYNSVKMATKIDVLEANTVYDDLKKRFEKNKTSGDKPEE